jgi:hypothetical protein
MIIDEAPENQIELCYDHGNPGKDLDGRDFQANLGDRCSDRRDNRVTDNTQVSFVLPLSTSPMSVPSESFEGLPLDVLSLIFKHVSHATFHCFILKAF